MNKLFFLLLVLGCCAVGCGQGTSTSSTSDGTQDATALPDPVNVHITGEISVPDNTEITLNADKEASQPLLSTTVQDGSFVLTGELDGPNFYTLVLQEEAFPVYLENGKQYEFVGEVDGQGQLQAGHINTDSEIMKDYERYTETLETKQEELKAQAAAAQSNIGNPGAYEQSVERSIALAEQREAMPDQVRESFLKDKDVSSGFKLYLIREGRVNKANYEQYEELLNTTPDSLKGTMLYRQSALKIDKVREFYENMPDFPDIHPRNPEGDSLKLEAFNDQDVLLFVFWGSWNDEARSDIREIEKKSDALQQLGVSPIYLTWEKNYDSWKEASEQLGLGAHNYRLNVTDKDFITENFGVNKLPHYLLVDAKDLSIINEHFIYPHDGLLENKLKKELAID